MKKLFVTLLWMISATCSAAKFNSQSVFVIEDGGQVLFEKQPDLVSPIASLTKLMTAMVVLDAHQNMQEIITIQQSDVDEIKHSMSRVRVGWQMTRAEALELALMHSDNRAATALGRTYPSGLPAFQEAMRAKIAALGLRGTSIVEPSGLSPSNVSTARDLAIIAIAASAYPDITRITTTELVQIHGTNFKNTNRLVGANGWDIRLSKTGYIEESGRCFVMRIVAAGKTATIVLLNAGSSSARMQDAWTIRRAITGEPSPKPQKHKKKKRRK